MKISIFFPLLLIIGLFVTGCSEIGSSITINNDKINNSIVFKNNSNKTIEITKKSSEEKIDLKMNEIHNEYKIEKITTITYVNDKSFYKRNDTSEVYLNIQHLY